MHKLRFLNFFFLLFLFFLVSIVSLNAQNNVVAHRGAWKNLNLPENSIASLENAIKLNCTGSEFDVRMTADGVLIVYHDATYHNLEIEKTKYVNLAEFKLSNGENLPTLKEYIKAGLKNNSSTKLVCEIKPSVLSKEKGQLIATKVVKLVRALKAEKMVDYISFDYDILKRINTIDPFAITQYLNGEKSPEQLKADGISGADYHFSVYKKNPEWIESAKKNQLILNVWTVNLIEDLDWFIDKKFNFITTDEPELLLERLKNPSNSKTEYQRIWQKEIDAFDILNGDHPLQNGILFTGSSSIRMWKDPAVDFNNPMILNRGFGGSQIIDLIENFDQVILNYHPKKIIIYSGDNDIQEGKSPEIVFGDFCTLYGMIKAKLPDTEVYYLAIKPSLNRWGKVLEMQKANTMIHEYLNTKNNGTYVDVFSPMIGLSGKPLEKWFVEDGLHMSAEGYELWTKILAPYISK